MSQHDRAEELPLLTESARITAVEALDRNRVDELERELLDRLSTAGRSDWVAQIRERGGEGVDWDRLETLMADASVDDDLAGVYHTLCERYERPYPSLVSVRAEAHRPIEFVAGQYVTLRYEDVPRPYSIANAPTDDGIELCIRRVPGGRLTDPLCAEVSVGDRVTLRGPNGEFVLQEPSGRDVAFLATGTGVAPLKSMIEYVYEQGRHVRGGTERDVWLFLGAGWEDDLAYRERFRELDDEYRGFHFVPTLTREPCLTDWEGETDYVQRVLTKYVHDDAVADADLDGAMARVAAREPDTDIEARIDPRNLDVYACGINAMVNALTGAVSALGVPGSNVRAEGYG